MTALQTPFDKVNSLPLNQRAMQLLRQAHQTPQSHGLYLIQLVQWALDREKIDSRQQDRIQSTLDVANRQAPDAAMKFLTGESEDGAETLLPDDSLNNLTPVQAGEHLISHLLSMTEQ